MSRAAFRRRSPLQNGPGVARWALRMRGILVRSLLFLFAAGVAGAAPEALVVVVGDLHSAYERTAQFVGRVDRLKREHPDVPLAVLINGDSLEYGNAVARRTAGAIDFALFAALARRGPAVINLGNHEPEFHDVAETVRRLEATGLTVIGGNLRDPATGQPYARPSAVVRLGPHALTIVGVTTDKLSTYRVAIRPQLDLADPAVWARTHFPALLGGAALPVVLSHSGLAADRAMLPVVPPGTLFAGAHDHLRFVHRMETTVYFHSGSWLDYLSVARLERRGAALAWEVEQLRLEAGEPPDPELAGLVRATLARELTGAETERVGRSPRELGPAEAAAFAVEAARVAAHADVAVVGATTFGAGLPAGDVTRFAFDACVRFDGTLWTADVDGTWLAALLRRANQGPDTPFAERGGENLVAAIGGEIRPGRTYRLATTDWVAKNIRTYLGDNPPRLVEQPHLKLKAAVVAAFLP